MPRVAEINLGPVVDVAAKLKCEFAEEQRLGGGR